MKRRAVKRVTPALLRRFSLPRIDDDEDKHGRGVVLVVGGSTTVPGAALLAGIAALRAGAGTLQFGVPREIAIPLGVAVPESLVASGGAIDQFAKHADAVLIGPGMPDRASSAKRARAIARRMQDSATLVLDATALPAAGAHARAIITPNPREMAELLGASEDDVKDNAPELALEASNHFECAVALRASTTCIAADGECYVYDGGSVGLATSGSGDTLAGVVAGFAARGADPLTATLWAVWAHGTAGRTLSRRIARTGFLARELLDALPGIIAKQERSRHHA